MVGTDAEIAGVTGGIDTHKDTHTAAVLDARGRVLGNESFPATAAGYARLVAWMQGFGEVESVGVEGTGSYGAGIARYLRTHQITILEVDRPNRAARRKQGKSDPLDAIAAARAVQAQTATGVPKARDGVVESLRALRVARRGAMKARTAAMNALKSAIVTAPQRLREQFDGLDADQLVETCARLRPGSDLSDPVAGTKQALRRLARRHQALDEEVAETDADLIRLVRQIAPQLLAKKGVGPEVASQLLVTAGDNPDRLRTEASFAALCGTSPLPASSGRTDRHRLNRGGDRAANCVLHTVVLVRMRHHRPTREYVARRTAQGLSKREIMRCLKRYVARELLPLVRDALAQPAAPAA